MLFLIRSEHAAGWLRLMQVAAYFQGIGCDIQAQSANYFDLADDLFNAKHNVASHC